MPLSLDNNDFHDGLLNSIEVDVEAAVVVLHADVYEDSDSAERTRVAFRFSNVSSFNTISNLPDMSSNRNFGNINYIRHAGDRTYLFLVNGVVEVTSESVLITTE